jgi:hypothetical protein
MRQNGVRSLAVRCTECRNETIIKADHWPGDLTVKSFEPRMVCTKCGINLIWGGEATEGMGVLTRLTPSCWCSERGGGGGDYGQFIEVTFQSQRGFPATKTSAKKVMLAAVSPESQLGSNECKPPQTLLGR